MPGRRLAEHDSSDPRIGCEAEVSQRLDERPLTIDLLVQPGLRGAPGALDGDGPTRLEDRPRPAKAVRVARAHLRPVRVQAVELRVDERRDVDAVDAHVPDVTVDVEVPKVDTAQPRVGDRAATHVGTA